MALALCLFLRIFSDLDHTFIVTLHTIYALTGFGEDELVYPILAYFTFEAMGVIGIVASHDGFVKNGKMTDIAIVGTVGT